MQGGSGLSGPLQRAAGRRWRGLQQALIVAIVYGLPVVFVLVPLLTFLVYSFFWVEGGAMHYSLSLRNYLRFFTGEAFFHVFWQTILLCLGVAALAILVAYPVAYFLTGLKGRMKATLVMLILVPLLMSYIIKIYALRSILGANGLLNQLLMALGIIDRPSSFFVFNLNAIMLTQLALLIPFAVLPILLSLERIPRNLLEASTDLGAGGRQTFLWVILPMSLPGVVAAATFVFVLAIGDFLTPQMVGGQAGFTFGRIVYSQFGIAFNWPFGAALSVILMGVIVIAMVVGAKYGSSRRGAA
jgi:spermidine/putrescine transport system permease protein